MTPAAANSRIAALRKKYSLQPAPESVARLAQLVAQRTDDNMDQIAKVVAGDPALKSRLLCAASAGTDDPIEDVQQAIFRCGVEAVLVLAMADPLLRAVMRTFENLLGVSLRPVEEIMVGAMDVDGYLAVVGFSGRANGEVCVRMGEEPGKRIAAALLATEPEKVTAAEITDAIGEIGNMIVGNFNSNLCDAGLSCKLSVPTVTASSAFNPSEVPSGRHQAYAFRYKELPLMIHITVESTG